MYKLKHNRCDCHPETCNCYKYHILDVNNEIISHTDDYTKATKMVELLNKVTH